MPRLKLLTILLVCASGCAPGVGPSEPALCDGPEAAMRDHAAALAEDGGEQSVMTGARLIRALDAGCGRTA